MNEIFGAYISATVEAPLDAVNERLLYTLAAKLQTELQITVLEAMVMLPEISTTTAHRRLKQLRADGWIYLQPNESDNRIKYVMLTQTTKNYFATLGAHMVNAVKGGAV